MTNDQCYVQSRFQPCFCKNVRIQEYQNQVAMKPFWRDKLVCVDSCLASEIAWLWHHGIKTHGCCCGHGNPQLAYIGVYSEHIEKMKELGYRNEENSTAECPEEHFRPLTITM